MPGRVGTAEPSPAGGAKSSPATGRRGAELAGPPPRAGVLGAGAAALGRILRGTWPRLLLAALTGAAGELCALGLIASAAWLITTAATRPPLAALGVAIVGVRAFALLRGGFRYLERLSGHDAALRAVAEVRVRLYSALAGRPSRHRSGDSLLRLVSDVDSVQDVLLRSVVPAVLAAVVGAATVALTTLMLPAAGAVVAAAVVVIGCVLPACANPLRRRAARRTSAARVDYAVRCLDVVEGARELAAFGATGVATRAAGEAAGRMAAARRRSGVLTAAASAVSVLVQGLATVLVALLALDAGFGAVPLAVLTLSALVGLEAVLPMVDVAGRYADLGPSLRRVAAELGTEAPAAPAEPDAGPEPGPGDVFPVVLAGGWVRHRPDRPCALRGADLAVERGRVVAVVGPSGAGKSTLLATLTGDARLAAGTVKLAWIPVAEKDPRWVRRAVRGLAESGYVFHTSIRANLVLARPDATDADLARAAGTAGLAGWIEDLPDGWDTVVGTDGEQLSGGQRQRLLLARALLADPPLMLLDEPCEGLHPAAADAVLGRVLRDVRDRGRSVVVVSHRLAALTGADEILVLDEGTVVQRGTHAQLVSGDGRYRELWDAERLAG
ncbi:thiol reductant ABC exporter subunit CydC [Amycolatopsis sp. NPDC021455]|uniref:thiol reductant ABC exporter subunit CydC n=1 Tax=Amycolatopsis sp. NPDC021455 TaxID=3154901 RepID=UPI0034028973